MAHLHGAHGGSEGFPNLVAVLMTNMMYYLVSNGLDVNEGASIIVNERLDQRVLIIHAHIVQVCSQTARTHI